MSASTRALLERIVAQGDTIVAQGDTLIEQNKRIVALGGFPTATSVSWTGSQRRGVNLVGMNMDLTWRAGGTGPTRNTNYPTYSTTLLDWFQNNNFGVVRLMFTWEAVQSSLLGAIPSSSVGTGYANYWSDLTDTITKLLARGIYVLLCPYQYNTASADTDATYDSASFTSAQFADFWAKFAVAINAVTGSDQRVAFDLINEPHTHAESGGKVGDIGITLAAWFDAAQTAIYAIRNAGVKNAIGVAGMAYTAASSFVSNGSAAAYLTLVDPTRNIFVTAHHYYQFQSHLTASTAHRDGAAAIVAWARTNNVLVQIGEIAADCNGNGVTTAQAQATWADWIAYQVANSDVLLGWTWWGNSAPSFWDTADFHWGLTTDNGATRSKFMDLIAASLGTTKR